MADNSVMNHIVHLDHFHIYKEISYWSGIVFMPCCKLKENILKNFHSSQPSACANALKMQFQGSACESIYLSMVNWQTEYVNRIVPEHMSCSACTEMSQWIWSASVLFKCPVIWKITLEQDWMGHTLMVLVLSRCSNKWEHLSDSWWHDCVKTVHLWRPLFYYMNCSLDLFSHKCYKYEMGTF